MSMSIVDADYDPPEVEHLLFAGSGKLAFDIGGNNGRVAALLAQRYTQVVSCEPAEESFARLAAIQGVTALQVAVSDRSGTVELAVQSQHIRSGQLTSPTGGGDEWVADRSRGGGGWGEIVDARTVPSVTLDELSDTYGYPNFIKCDVEGHEGRVFAGGSRTVKYGRPALYIEIHNAELGAEIRGYLDRYYPYLREVWHPYYKPDEFGAKNHYWLVSDGR